MKRMLKILKILKILDFVQLHWSNVLCNGWNDMEMINEMYGLYELCMHLD